MKNLITFLLLILSFQSFSQSIDDSLLIHYQFDGNVIDTSGNGFDGTAFGVQYGVDRDGNSNSACYFDGIDDYVDFPNLEELKPPLPVSFSFWIKYNSTDYTDRAVLNTSFEEDISSGILFTSQASTGKFAIGYGDGSDFYSSSSRRSFVSNVIIDTCKWHFIALVLVSANNMKIYVDCLEAYGTFSGSGGDLYYSQCSGSIGRHDQNMIIPAYYFKGAIDDFRYWNRELSFNDIDSLCNDLITSSENLQSLENEILVYPNPVKKILQIGANYNEFEYIFIYNLMGQIVYEGKFETNINIEKLKSGLYFLQVQSKHKGQSEIEKFIKE